MAVSRRVQTINWVDGNSNDCDDEVVTELPAALTYNKHSHVVMMVTPTALEDFALGFSLTEGIIRQVSDILDFAVLTRENGLELALTVNQESAARLSGQRRNLAGRTGCGLCGAESLEQAIHIPAIVSSQVSVTSEALQRAVQSLNSHQPLQLLTGAVHGAAWCNIDGEILVLREDVGRHNALDKLIGHLARTGFDCTSGFALVSSRASYEMVSKAAAAGIELLASVSAPTTLAIDFAHRSGMTLVGFARPGRYNVYTLPGRIRNL
jgi:FdhD protein